jgi:hypothetical protein
MSLLKRLTSENCIKLAEFLIVLVPPIILFVWYLSTPVTLYRLPHNVHESCEVCFKPATRSTFNIPEYRQENINLRRRIGHEDFFCDEHQPRKLQSHIEDRAALLGWGGGVLFLFWWWLCTKLFKIVGWNPWGTRL